MPHARRSKVEAGLPAQQIPPSAVLYALGLGLDGLDQKVARRVFSLAKDQASSCVSLLVKAGILAGEAALTDRGREWLRTTVNLGLIERLPRLAAYRVAAGSLILGTKITSETTTVLGDIKAVSALLLFPDLLSAEFPTTRGATFELIARRIAADLVRSHFRGFKGGVPVVTGRIDPLVLDLFEAATGHRSLEQGIEHLQQAAGMPVTILTPRTVDSRWRTLTKARFGTMVTPKKRKGEEKLSVRVASEATRIMSPHWTLIYDAFKAYREIDRVPLEDFKAALGVLFGEGLIELRAIDVPKLFPSKESGLSATDLGGMTFQLVRLRG